MAILSKIRERSMFLILVIGLALFAFVLDPSTLGDFFNSSKVDTVGEVNGETISRKEFAKALEDYKTQTGNRVSEMQAAKTVWENLLRQKIYKAQLAEAGVTIGEADIWNAIISSPSVKTNPQFLNEAGLFDEEKLKEFLANAKENDPQLWGAWSNYMKQIEDNLARTMYNDLVTAGLGASLKEGELQYFNDNTKISSQLVYVPYTSVADSLVKVTKSEIDAYVKAHPNEYKVEASRDIKYVKFNITATTADEEAIKNEVAELINDSEKTNFTGLKNVTDVTEFFEENASDTPLNNNFRFKNTVPAVVADQIMAANKGDVVGPYKDRDFFKISKIAEITELPDSAKASHILIPFAGALSAGADVTKTEEQAKATADSLLTVIKRNKSKFADLAKEFSSDKGSSEKGGVYDWFNYTRMTPEFRDFVFEGKTGDMGVVKTPFGFHVIKIDGQKNKQKAVKLATFSKRILASEGTENTIFQNAETFALDLANGKDFDEVVKEKKLASQPAVGLKVLDENVPGVGREREIVRWAFSSDTKVGDYKRFDTENGHIVAVLTGETKEGLMPASKAASRVRPIIANEKKAAIIDQKMNGATLADIAKTNNVNVRTATAVTLKAPTISGVGFEPKIVGAMAAAKENQLYTKVEGAKGVFAFKVTKVELPVALPNYDSFRKRLADQRKTETYNMYEAVKKVSDIEDNRAMYYGVN